VVALSRRKAVASGLYEALKAALWRAALILAVATYLTYNLTGGFNGK